MAPQVAVNWAIYHSLPPEEARYQLAHINDSKVVSIATAYIICVPINFLAVILRFVSRRIGRTKYGADDWIMLVGLSLVVVADIPSLLATFAYGGAHHAIRMAENDPVRFAKSVFAGEILYPPNISVVKISTLLLFARIFPAQKFKRVLWAIGLFISTYTTIMIITMIFQCRPIKRVWDSTIEAECIDVSKVWIVMASLNVVTDFLILCLPLPQLWKLQMHRGTKLQLMGIFSIGGFATVVSIYRIPQLRGLSLSSFDPTWTDVETTLWSIVEVCAATLGACAITYRPLFNWVFGIQSSPSGGSEGKTALAGATKSSGSGVNKNRLGLGSANIKMQALNSSHPHPHVSASVDSSRVTRTEDGFRRIQDPPDVRELRRLPTT